MGEGKKVLVCDDSILARMQLSEAIKKCCPDVTIEQAADGIQAIGKYTEFHPDLTFLDIVMPKKDGIEAARSILSGDEKANIVIVSSVGTQNKVREAIEIGVRDFIQKPFAQDQVTEVLRYYLGEES